MNHITKKFITNIIDVKKDELKNVENFITRLEGDLSYKREEKNNLIEEIKVLEKDLNTSK